MSLYSYFKKEASLPSTSGPLCKSILSPSIKSANNSVSTLLIQESPTVRKKIPGEYDAFTPEEKARRCASEIRVTRAIRKLTKDFSDRSLKESSVCTWMNKYKEEMKRNSVTGVQAIPMHEVGKQETRSSSSFRKQARQTSKDVHYSSS